VCVQFLRYMRRHIEVTIPMLKVWLKDVIMSSHASYKLEIMFKHPPFLAVNEHKATNLNPKPTL